MYAKVCMMITICVEFLLNFFTSVEKDVTSAFANAHCLSYSREEFASCEKFCFLVMFVKSVSTLVSSTNFRG